MMVQGALNAFRPKEDHYLPWKVQLLNRDFKMTFWVWNDKHCEELNSTFTSHMIVPIMVPLLQKNASRVLPIGIGVGKGE